MQLCAEVITEKQWRVLRLKRTEQEAVPENVKKMLAYQIQCDAALLMAKYDGKGAATLRHAVTGLGDRFSAYQKTDEYLKTLPIAKATNTMAQFLVTRKRTPSPQDGEEEEGVQKRRREA